MPCWSKRNYSLWKQIVIDVRHRTTLCLLETFLKRTVQMRVFIYWCRLEKYLVCRKIFSRYRLLIKHHNRLRYKLKYLKLLPPLFPEWEGMISLKIWCWNWLEFEIHAKFKSIAYILSLKHLQELNLRKDKTSWLLWMRCNLVPLYRRFTVKEV